MGDDAELQELRRKRLAQLQAQQGGAAQNAAQQEAMARQQEEQRGMMMAQLLSSAARERLSRIALVKPDLARNVSDRIIALAQSGQIRSKVEEDQLIQWLEQIQGTQKQTVVKIQRKSYDDDDDDY